MTTRGGLSWAWVLNIGVPVMLLALAYGCGGQANLSQEALYPAVTALEGRALAERLASSWDASARLVKVEGARIQPNERLAERPDSLWVYMFTRAEDGAVYAVRRDGRGTVDAGPSPAHHAQSLWEEPLTEWRVDSPFVLEQVAREGLPLGDALKMELTQDGVWRVGAEDGKFLREFHIDARTGRRVLGVANRGGRP